MKHKYFSKTRQLLIFLFSLCSMHKFIICEQQQQLNLQIQKIYDLSLAPSQTLTFRITIPSNWSQNQNLYISGYSPINDPEQVPKLRILGGAGKGGDSGFVDCEEQPGGFEDVCFISAGSIQKGKVFQVEATCKVNCKSNLVAYLSQTVQLDLNQQIELQAGQSPLEQTLRIYIPKDQQFTEIWLITSMKDYDNIKQSVQIYVTYGADNLAMPTKAKHNTTKVVNWGFSKAVVLKRSKQFRDGSVVNVLLAVGANTTFTFETRKINNNTRYITLNQQFLDYLQPSTPSRLYELDLAPFKNSAQQLYKQILIQFYQYSGSPTIQVSFNKQFKNERTFKGSEMSSWIRYLITVEMMSSPEFNGSVFVRVNKSEGGAAYSIYARPKLYQYNVIYEDQSQVVQIQGGDVGVFVYRHFEAYVQNSSDTVKSIKVDVMNQGEVQLQEVKAYQCKQKMIADCAKTINSKTKVSSIPQNENYKQLRTYISKQKTKIIQFSTDDCIKNKYYFECITMIVLVPSSTNKAAIYSTRILSQNQLITLSQGQSYMDYIQKQAYRYYKFYLSASTMQMGGLFNQNYSPQLTFYVHVISGQVQIMASHSIVKPELQDKASKGVKVGTNTITFKNDEIKQGVYYVTVYAHQYSDFVINSIVRRPVKIDNSEPFGMGGGSRNFYQKLSSTSLQLLQGIAQTIELQPGYEDAQFKIRSVSNQTSIQLTVTELLGKVKTYYFRKSSKNPNINHQKKQCQYNWCQIKAEKGQYIYLIVTGQIRKLQKFTIAYKQSRQCYKYPIGTPVFISLLKQQQQCLQFVATLQQNQSLQISNSLNNIQLMDKNVEITIQFDSESSRKQANQTYLMSTNTHIFEAEEIEQLCNINRECKIRVVMKSLQTQQQQLHFHLICQKFAGLITIYDGILQRIQIPIKNNITRDDWAKFVKYFRCPINKQDSIQVFLNTQSYTNYKIIAKIADANSSRFIQNYPKLSQIDNIDAKNKSSNIFFIESSEDSHSFSFLPINKLKIKKIISQLKIVQPWILVSVYPFNTDTDVSDINSSLALNTKSIIYSIQLTQSQRSIYIGQEHVGFLESNEKVVYEVYSSSSSILSIRSLYSNSICYRIYDQNKKQIVDFNIHIQNPPVVPLTFYIQSYRSSNCMYQISLQDYQDSILTLTQGFPTKVVLQYEQQTYFLYYHNKNSSFKIYEFQQAGASKLFATPLSGILQNKTLSNLLGNIHLNKFKYKAEYLQNIEIKAKQTGQDYCFNCYYMIGIRANPSVHEDIVVARSGTPVFIREHAIVDSYLEQGEEQTFMYYIGNQENTNLSIDVTYGRVTVTVKSYYDNPQGRLVRIQSVQNDFFTISLNQDKTNSMGGPPVNIKIPTDSLNQKWRYKIQVKAVKKSLYHLQVIKIQDVFKISQGITSRLTVPAFGQMNLKYNNLIDNGYIYLNAYGQDFNINPLSGVAYFYGPGQNVSKKKKIQSQTYRIGRVFSMKIQGKRGHYQIILRNDVPTPLDITVLIPRAGLSQLIQNTQVIGNHQSIYQIFIQEGSYAIIETFQCQGNIKIRGSNNLDAIQRGKPKNDQIDLLHENLGGHYVIRTPENVSGQYFIRVQSKQYSVNIDHQVNNMNYMMFYRLHKNNNTNPYNVIQPKNNQIRILKSPIKQNITVLIQNIKSYDQSIKIDSIAYSLTIGSSQEDIKSYLFCLADKNTKHLLFYESADITKQQFSINISKLEILRRMGTQKSLYIGVIAFVNVKYTDNQLLEDFIYLYQPGIVGSIQENPVISTTGLFEIIVLVCLIIGGLVTIYALAIYLYKLKIGYQNTNQLVEEDSQQKEATKKDQFQISGTIVMQKTNEKNSEQELQAKNNH